VDRCPFDKKSSILRNEFEPPIYRVWFLAIYNLHHLFRRVMVPIVGIPSLSTVLSWWEWVVIYPSAWDHGEKLELHIQVVDISGEVTVFGRGASKLSFPPSNKFKLRGLINWVILLFGLYYKILGFSLVHKQTQVPEEHIFQRKFYYPVKLFFHSYSF
jgi:hypothetical protein